MEDYTDRFTGIRLLWRIRRICVMWTAHGAAE